MKLPVELDTVLQALRTEYLLASGTTECTQTKQVKEDVGGLGLLSSETLDDVAGISMRSILCSALQVPTLSVEQMTGIWGRMYDMVLDGDAKGACQMLDDIAPNVRHKYLWDDRLARAAVQMLGVFNLNAGTLSVAKGSVMLKLPGGHVFGVHQRAIECDGRYRVMPKGLMQFSPVEYLKLGRRWVPKPQSEAVLQAFHRNLPSRQKYVRFALAAAYAHHHHLEWKAAAVFDTNLFGKGIDLPDTQAIRKLVDLQDLIARA